MYSPSNRFMCRSSRGMTRSSSSLRQLPTQRSAMPFCQGLAKDVRTGLIVRERTAAGTSSPYLASRSKIEELRSRIKRERLPQLLHVPHYAGGRYYAGYWNGPHGRVEHDHGWDHDHDRDQGRWHQDNGKHKGWYKKAHEDHDRD